MAASSSSFSSAAALADADDTKKYMFSAAHSTAVVDDADADNPPRREKYDVFISFRGDDTRLGITSHLHAALLQKKFETYIDEDVYRVLRSNMETPNVEAIRVNWYKLKYRPLKRADFKKMSNLIMLSSFSPLTASLDLPNSLCYLEWRQYALESLPSNFYPKILVELHMPHSKLKKLWKEEQILVNLQVIDLEWCTDLTEVPNLSGSLKIVEINLTGCLSLVEIPLYFQHLDKLTHLDLGRCTSLKNLMPGNIRYLDLQCSGIKELPKSVWSNENISHLDISRCFNLEKLPTNICKLKCLPTNICMLKCLKELDLSGCSTLEHFPEILEPMKHLESLNLSKTLVKELHSSIELLLALKRIQLQDCKGLSSIPKSICKLKCPEELNLSCCSTLQHFLEILEPMEHLESLILIGTTVKELHSSIELLHALKRIQLQHCKGLSSIPKSICKLKRLEELNFFCCSKLEHFPEILQPMEHLESLILSGTTVKELHSSTELLPMLKRLELQGCNGLSSIPKSICKLKCLEKLDLSCCSTLQHFPEILETMEHLESLNLRQTSIKELHSSIELLPALKRIQLQDCKGLSSILKSIKLKCLKELNLFCCSKLELFPKILEPMEHLESLILIRTAIKELHSSIELLPALKRIQLRDCKGLSSIPKSICKLKCLEELNLSCCSKLEHFPEILEPMEHLESLILIGTTVKELHSSIKLLHALKRIQVQHCKGLSSIPKGICKLKCLEELNFFCCSKLEHFLEILEPMEHLESLILSGTAVIKLHSSIELLPMLKRLELQGCNGLSSIPKSICKLKCLEKLDLSCCFTLQHFPEILEPMEHLKSLNLSKTSIKELHSSIELLPALKKLKLKGCYRLSSIPKSICELKCLKELNLSGCSILRNFPEILKPLKHLKSLKLSRTEVEQLYTSSIEFLPALKNIELEGCNMLSCISKSMFSGEAKWGREGASAPPLAGKKAQELTFVSAGNWKEW